MQTGTKVEPVINLVGGACLQTETDLVIESKTAAKCQSDIRLLTQSTVKEINLITDKINKMSLVEDVQAESPQQHKEVLD